MTNLAPRTVGVPQHLVALKRAQRIRMVRCDWKRDVAESPGLAGAQLIVAALRRTPDELHGMRIAEALGAQRRWGTRRVTRLLAHLRVSEERTLGALTDRQVDLVASALLEPYAALRGPRER